MASKLAFIDFETFGTVDLKKAGADAYFEHPDTGIWCLCFAFDDEPEVSAWRPVTWSPLSNADSTEAARRLIDHVASGGTVVAHGAAFELLAWAARMAPAGWPELKPEQTVCTMARAAALALPLDLYGLSKALHLNVIKDKEGHALMLRVCRPRSFDAAGRPVWWNDPQRIARLIEYCRTDVRVEREVYRRLHTLSTAEMRLWQLDYKMNRRGVCIDVETVKVAAALVADEAHHANVEIAELTSTLVSTVTNAGKLTQWLKASGVKLADLRKRTVSDALKRSDLDDSSRRVLELRQLAGKASTAKLKAMLTAVSKDHRARGLVRFHVASTGRWGGARVQPHNLPRSMLKQAWHVTETIKLMHEPRARDSLVVFAGNAVMEAIASCLRAMIIAGPGSDLIGGDYANIEGRVAAWLAGEHWKIEAFNAYDTGTGADLYKLAYARSFHLQPEDVTDQQRQIGKVMELSLQYQGALGAFTSMAANYGLTVLDEGKGEDNLADGKITADTVQGLVCAWRSAHPRIVSAWAALKEAAMLAISRPGLVAKPIALGGRITYCKEGPFLFCYLPNDRRLAYVRPRLERATGEDSWKGWQIAYEGTDSLTKQWCTQYAYGGLLFENIVQAVARDCLAEGLFNLEEAGYPVVLHVHDEAVAEVPEGFGTLEDFSACMTRLGPWAAGLPVTVKSWRGKRYGLK